MKKLIIAAGTGFLGQVLIEHFRNKAEEIVVLTRGKSGIKNTVRYIHWDAKTMTGWERELETADVLINLAGKSVDCRYTPKNKSEIMASRIDSTSILNRAVLQCTHPPKHWLNSSTATIYRHSENKQMDEVKGEIGFDFSMNVARMWEKAFFQAETPQTKKTALRTSIVLGKKGGAYIPLKRLAYLGFGGKQGNGRQFVSWIHEKDFARATYIIDKEMEGVVNVVSPHPVRNRDFMKMLREVKNIPFGIPIGRLLIKIGAKLIGTETELVLKSRNLIPKRLQENGFKFIYGDLEKALSKLT
ncbi:MAG: TIGR01777 family protein [Flavobacterium psychrophilum]|nr:MAG: TIGR01777 family protein [Flavobacterium psychrophilum]